MLDGVSEEKKIKEVKEYLYRTEVFDKALKEHLPKYTINRKLAAIQERVDMMRSYEIDNLYVMSQINDLTGKQIYEKLYRKASKKYGLVRLFILMQKLLVERLHLTLSLKILKLSKSSSLVYLLMMVNLIPIILKVRRLNSLQRLKTNLKLFVLSLKRKTLTLNKL